MKTALKSLIVVKWVNGDCLAEFPDLQETREHPGKGRTPDEAIGNLLSIHQVALGLRIEEAAEQD